MKKNKKNPKEIGISKIRLLAQLDFIKTLLQKQDLNKSAREEIGGLLSKINAILIMELNKFRR